jgi:phosphoglycolate phosphatase
MNKTGYTHIIWDFNGTIYNDVDACIKSANRLLGAYDLPLVTTVEQYRSLFGFPIQDYYARMGFDFEKTPYSVLAPEWMNYYFEYSADSTVYPDVLEVLDAIHQKGIGQWILSATEVNMLRGQLEGLGILSRFNGILGLDNIHARSKKEIGVAWKKANPDICALMIGDTDHDAEVAAAMGVDCVLVATGHQNRERLEKCNCIAVVDTVKDVLKLL